MLWRVVGLSTTRRCWISLQYYLDAVASLDGIGIQRFAPQTGFQVIWIDADLCRFEVNHEVHVAVAVDVLKVVAVDGRLRQVMSWTGQGRPEEQLVDIVTTDWPLIVVSIVRGVNTSPARVGGVVSEY